MIFKKYMGTFHFDVISLMRFFIASLFILGFCATVSLADTVILKNTRSIDGIIEEENEDYIVLNVGGGSLTLYRTEIESIEKSDESTNARILQRWKKEYFESFPAPTPEDQKLLDDLNELRLKKRGLLREVSRKNDIIKEVSNAQQEISHLQDEQVDLGNRLKAIKNPKKMAVKYNSLVVDLDAVYKKMKDALDALDDLKKDRDSINAEVSEHIRQFMEFKRLFEKRYNELTAKENISTDQENFYENLKKALAEFQEDIRYEEIEFIKEANSIIIPVTFNNNIETKMIVDTGATVTVITEDLAARLGINRYIQDTELILADGRRMLARSTILDSIKVSGMEARRIEVVVAKIGSLRGGAEGLLGMNFLKKFAFSIDANNQKLIFSSLMEL